jgi:hypothetical protein
MEIHYCELMVHKLVIQNTNTTNNTAATATTTWFRLLENKKATQIMQQDVMWQQVTEASMKQARSHHTGHEPPDLQQYVDSGNGCGKTGCVTPDVVHIGESGGHPSAPPRRCSSPTHAWRRSRSVGDRSNVWHPRVSCGDSDEIGGSRKRKNYPTLPQLGSPSAGNTHSNGDCCGRTSSALAKPPALRAKKPSRVSTTLPIHVRPVVGVLEPRKVLTLPMSAEHLAHDRKIIDMWTTGAGTGKEVGPLTCEDEVGSGGVPPLSNR